MAWIEIIGEANATGNLAKLYAQERSTWGVDNILKIHSLNPPSLDAHLLLYRTLMYGKSGLSRTQREMIGTVVSAINRCEY
jgi:alkylhydroperoxidase family enzyme